MSRFQFILILFLAARLCSSLEDYSSNQFYNATVSSYVVRLTEMAANADRTILIHEHIPKAGGTALAFALSSGCRCNTDQPAGPGVCHDCRQAKSTKGNKYPYSVSRVTAWPCGGHAPLSRMKRLPCDGSHVTVEEMGFSPIFVVMLREPFARFVSEIEWSARWGICGDWSVRTKNRDGTWSYLAGVTPLTPDADRVVDYAAFPENLMIHHRNIKMIGGYSRNFNMDFDAEVEAGSRWVLGDDRIIDIYKQALKIVRSDEQVLLGIHERFKESLCVLEVLFGHLQSFDWDPNTHSHHAAKTYTSRDHKGETKTLDHYRNSAVYTEWLKKNYLDVKLYNESVVLFELQFQAALTMLRHRVASDNNSIKSAPHCKSFLN